MDDLQTFLDKYRPRRYEDFFGQDDAVAHLSGISLSGTPSSLVLTGPPGSGKTSLAKVYAQSFSCKSAGTSAAPCLACEACLRFRLDPMDTTAAALREIGQVTAQDMWSSSRYTFYFYDEAQRAALSSFDHLLLNMQNPSSYSRFIFATTKPAAIPSTVLGRCTTVRTALVEGDHAVALLTKVAVADGMGIGEDVLRVVASAKGGDARSLVAALWHIKTLGLATVEQARKHFQFSDPMAALTYLTAVFDGRSLREQILLLRALQQAPVAKQTMIHALLQHIYSTECLGLPEDIAEYADLNPIRMQELASAIEDLAKRSNQQVHLFWQDAIKVWEPNGGATKAIVEALATRFDSQMQMLRQLPLRSRRSGVSIKPKGRPRSRSQRDAADVAQLAYEQAKAIWTAASFLTQMHNATLNMRILIRWQRMSVSSPDAAARKTGQVLHKLGMAVQRWHPRRSRWCYVYAHEQSAQFGLLTVILLHLPKPSLERAEQFLRSRLMPSEVSAAAIKIGWARSGKPHKLAYIQHRNLRFILGGLDRGLLVRDQESGAMPLVDALKIPRAFRRTLETWRTLQRYRVSRLIGDKAQQRVTRSDMPFLDVWADGAWAFTDGDWEFREFADRVSEREMRNRLQLETRGQQAVIGTQTQSPADADAARLRKRTWRGWWVAAPQRKKDQWNQ